MFQKMIAGLFLVTLLSLWTIVPARADGWSVACLENRTQYRIQFSALIPGFSSSIVLMPNQVVPIGTTANVSYIDIREDADPSRGGQSWVSFRLATRRQALDNCWDGSMRYSFRNAVDGSVQIYQDRRAQ